MTRLFSLLILLSIIIGAFLSLKPGGGKSTVAVSGLPWQIEVLPDGRSKVFGVTLGQDTLGQAREQLGPDMQLAIISASANDYSLEMYYNRYTAGVFSGKLVLGAEPEAEQLAQMLERSTKTSYMESGARKFRLHPDDLPLAWRATVQSLTFIPTVNLDQPTAIKRFGRPAEIINSNEQTTHLLYPDKGLDLILNEDGKDILQYVAPGEFYRLRDPLPGDPDLQDVNK
ncbi:MAG TPA: hypothetical protein ENI74_05205 [Gammaproteobacteria bacterium]|nr:hypothetical protein [Gammaproteobacteria bacterium]